MTLSYIPSDTNDEGILKAPASGILPSGQAVIVNADGTVSVVAPSDDSAGTPEVFESATSTYMSSTFDSNSNKVVIAYRDGGNSNYGTAVVGTLNGASISFGTPVVFEAAASVFIAATFDSNSNKVVIAYRDQGNSNYGTAIVGTVSGTGISFGTAVVFASTRLDAASATFDSNSNKVVIAYWAQNSNSGTAIIGTVSGTGISFGTPVVYNSGGSSNFNSAVFDSNSNKVVIAYINGGNSSYGTAIVGTVSGTGISFGSAVVFESVAVSAVSAVFDSNSNKVVIAYVNSSAGSQFGTTIVGTVSGTGISFGTAVVFENANTTYISAVFDSNSNKVVISFDDANNSDYGTAVVGTVSGTGISFGNAVVFESATVQWLASTFDSNANKVVISYRDNGNSNYGTAVVFQTASTNLTAENYIGMSSGGVVDNSITQAVGSPAVFESASISGRGKLPFAAFDSTNNRVVIAYQDSGNSNYGTAVVGTLSGTSISFGTPVVFHSQISDNPVVVFDSSNSKVVVSWINAQGTAYGASIVGTVSGNTISFGSAVTFINSTILYLTSVFDSTNNKVVHAYSNNATNGTGVAIVGTVSGNNISFGSAVTFDTINSPGVYYCASGFDTSIGKVIISYANGNSSNYGTVIIGTVSGTSISFGSKVVYASASTIYGSVASNNNGQFVIAFRDGGNSNRGKGIVGTISGTTPSFGTEVQYNASFQQAPAAVYDPIADKTVIAFRDQNDGNKGKFIVGTVSGTSISFGTAVVFESGSMKHIGPSTFDSVSNKVVTPYSDVDNSNFGTACVFQNAYTNITRGQVPSGTQATTNIIGSVSSNQSGLTAGQAYYVQTDGTITTTAGTPSVFAGTAISATKLLVKT